jgi:hypothetical protein
MSETTKRKILITFDCEHLLNSPVFGDITDEMLFEHIQAFLNVFEAFHVNAKLREEYGDFYNITNPVVTSISDIDSE